MSEQTTSVILMRQRDEWIARAARVEAENEALRRALKPFADFSTIVGPTPPRGLHNEIYAYENALGRAVIRVSDCAAAAELLELIISGEKP